MKRTHGPGFRLSDSFWAKVEPLLPARINTHRYGGGRPRAPDRRCLDGILFVLRTGCQWRAALTDYDELKGLDWSWLSADGCQTKAPLAGEKKRPQPDRPGQAGHQAQPAGRGGGRARRPGRGRSQPQRS